MAVKEQRVLDPDDLNEADREILDELQKGRGTPKFLAERIGTDRSYISQRLKRLAEHNIVEKLDTGLYELVDDPRDGAGRVDVEAARDHLGAALDAYETGNDEVLGEALEAARDALGGDDD